MSSSKLHQATLHLGEKSQALVKHFLWATTLTALLPLEFYHVSPDRGVGVVVKHLGKATGNLYSAVFETMGILCGRRRLFGAVLAGFTAVGTVGVFHNDLLDFHYRVQHDMARSFNQDGPLKAKPFKPDGHLFAENRRPDWYRLDPQYAVYNPRMLKKYIKDKTVRSYVDLMIEEAEKNDLNPIWFVNQLYQESVGLAPSVVLGETNSNKGAVGIAQFLPETAMRLYGVSEEDLKDPYKAIPLAAKHMGILTKQHGGDQILAMVSYNGGEKEEDGPVTFVKKKLGENSITGIDWFYHMHDRRYEKNFQTGYAAHAWHNETYKYVAIVTGASWSDSMNSLASNLKVGSFTFSFHPS